MDRAWTMKVRRPVWVPTSRNSPVHPPTDTMERLFWHTRPESPRCKTQLICRLSYFHILACKYNYHLSDLQLSDRLKDDSYRMRIVTVCMKVVPLEIIDNENDIVLHGIDVYLHAASSWKGIKQAIIRQRGWVICIQWPNNQFFTPICQELGYTKTRMGDLPTHPS